MSETELQTEWPQTPAGLPPRKPGRLGFLRELPALIVMAFGLAFLIKTFLLQAFFIPSASMEPTLFGCVKPSCPAGKAADRVLVNKLVYRFRPPARGEVIVFIAEKFEQPKSFIRRVIDGITEGLGATLPAEKDYIKRVIGLPGETIEVTSEGVFITPRKGARFKLDEPYIFSPEVQGPAQQPFKIPKDHFFVMGDNRGNSSDSRSSLGPIARSDVIGKAFVRIWPPRRMDLLDEPVYERPKPKKKGKGGAKGKDDKGRGDASGLPLPPPAVAFAAAGTALGARRWVARPRTGARVRAP